MLVVTGVTGFLGKYLVKKLNTNFPGEKYYLLNDNENLLDIKTLKLVPKKPKVVIHMAAETNTSKKDQSTNDMGTKNLLTVLKLDKKSHFVFISTVAIYAGRNNTSVPVDSQSMICANNEYARSKFRAERLLINESKRKGFKLSIVRLPTLYGAGCRENSLFAILTRLVKNRSFLTKLNWPGLIGLMGVDEAAGAILRICKLKSRSKIKVVILCRENKTLSEICQQIYTDQKIKYRQIILPDFFWKTAVICVNAILRCEFIIPTKLHFIFWRISLVIDSKSWCDTGEANLLLETRI